jgi:hypothetical protein
MKPEHLEVLSALFDGERVDPALLAEALADPQAADALADFVGLSVIEREDRQEPSEGFYTRMDALLHRQGLRDRLARFFLPALAASLILVAATTGYVARALLGPSEVIAVVRPPAPVQPAPAVLTWLPPVSDLATPLPRTVRADRSAPPTSELRLRFLRWEDTAAGLGQRPE